MESPVKIGVVGCARILPAHLRGLKALWDNGYQDFRITALCSRRPEDAFMFRERGEGPEPRASVITHALDDPLNAPHMYVSDIHDDMLPEVFTDWRELLRGSDVDVVLNLTPVYLHHPVTLDFLQAGKHVFVEKPFAVSIKAGQRMIQQATANGLQLGVAEVMRYRESARRLRWLMDSGQIGDMQMWLSGGMGARDWSPDVIIAKTPWRHEKLKAGGGPAVDGAVHLFDQIRYVCGEIVEISAMAPQLEPRRVLRDETGTVIESVENEVEDAYFAHLKFASGAVGMVFGGVAGHGEPISLEGGPAVYGTLGCIKGGEVILDDGRRADASALFDAGLTDELRERWFPWDLRDGFALQWLDFLRSLENDSLMETDGEQGLRDLACSFAILESATLNRPVRVADVLSGGIDAYQGEINAHYGLS